MTLSPGTRLGPYEVLSPLGAGGMGEVFRARDTRLGRDVAVKVLPDHLAADPKALRRFESEARAVAALSHPNILFLLDVGETNGVHYAVTELLEGDNLRGLIARGPVPLKRALEIAHHVADALAAAHERGIVHRDVKPENVFLTRDGHVKLLDFGLARHENAFRDDDDSHTPTVSARTEAGAVVGTVAYMSPEQARGIQVDHRTDQFSLGVTLYEMLAGRRPFRGTDGASLISAILRDEPEPLASLAPATPVPVRLVVERCLAKEPHERYASTRDLAHDLASWREQVSGAPVSGVPVSGALISAPAGTLPTAGRLTAARRRLVAAVAAVAAGVLVLAASAGTWLWNDTRSRRSRTDAAKATAPQTSRLDPKRVVVAVFENRTGDVSLDPVGRMAAEWITEGISGIRIDVVPSADVFDVPGAQHADGKPAPRETLRALAERTGAGIVVSGSYYVAGADVRIQGQISEVATGKLLRALEPVTAPRSDPMPAIDDVRHQVRDVIAVRLELEEEGSFEGEELRPPKYAAFREFQLGSEKLVADTEGAIAHLRRALELDPDFVTPRFIIASMLWYQGRFDEGAREIALIEPKRSALTPAYRHLLDVHRALLARRLDELPAIARKCVALAPGDLDLQFHVGGSELWANRPRETVQWLTSPIAWERWAVPTRPFAAIYFETLAKAHHALGQHTQELEAVRRGLAVYTDRPASLLLSEVRALVALDRHAEVEKLLEEALARPADASLPVQLMLEAAAELRGHGHAKAAREMGDRCVSKLLALPNEKRGDAERRDLALALLAAERWKEALPLLETVEKEQPRQGPRWKGLRALAALHAGDGAASRRIGEELRQLDGPYLYGEHLVFVAALAAARGERDEAVGVLRRAIAAGYLADNAGASFWAHRALELAPLLGYPPFEELIKPKG